MTKTPERIDLSKAADLRDVVHRAVASLALGEVIGVPTETCYQLAGSALKPTALDILSPCLGRNPLGGSICLRSFGELRDWAPDVSALGRRLARRCWPGPLTLRIPSHASTGLASRLPRQARDKLLYENRLPLRWPAQRVLSEIVRLTTGPILLASPFPEGDHPHAVEASTLSRLPDVSLILDQGAGQACGPTVVSVDVAGWSIDASGPLSEAELQRKAATWVVFVCTGNTCRSPMAESLFKAMLAERLKIPQDQLERAGYWITSAGLAAARGARAAPDAIEVVRRRGADLSEHLSQPFSSTLAAHADWIIPMTLGHLLAIEDDRPDLRDRLRLLDTEGHDIEDPIGRGRDVYEATADQIENGLNELIHVLGVR